jgi:hypothetical protein
MIEIHVNAARVERVLFVAGSDLEEDFDHAAWQAIRHLVDRIDRRLRRAAASVAKSPDGLARNPEREARR